jgi:hypothetical protein
MRNFGTQQFDLERTGNLIIPSTDTCKLTYLAYGKLLGLAEER